MVSSACTYVLPMLLLASAHAARHRLRDTVPVAHSVAAWPAGAGSTRWLVRVAVDADAVRLHLPFNNTDVVCLLSARSGHRVRNLAVLRDPSLASFLQQAPPKAVGGRRRVQLQEQPVAMPGAGVLAFEPEAGPGEYELYTDCQQAADLVAEPAWSRTIQESAPLSLPSALMTRRETRSAAVGPYY